MKKHHYISILSRDKVRSYLVRVPQFKDGIAYHNRFKLITKHFSVSVYGTQKKSLAAAIKWRDQYFIDNGLPLSEKLKTYAVRMHSVSSKNKSGVIGVALRLNKNDGSCYEYRATWTVVGSDNKAANRHEIFPCELHGVTEAFELACIARWESAKPQRPLVVVNKDAMPCMPPVPYVINGELFNG